MNFDIDSIVKYLKRSVYTFTLIVMVSTFFFLFIVGKSYQGLNDYSSSVSEKIYQSVYSAELDALNTIVVDYSYWTDALNAISGPIDKEFLEDNFGEYFSETFSIDALGIYSPQGELKVTVTNGIIDEQLNTTFKEPSFTSIIKRASETNYANPIPSTMVATFNNTPHLVAASVFVPSAYNADYPEPKLYGVLVVTRALDEELLDAWQEKFNLYDLEIVDANQPVSKDYVSSPLYDLDGNVIYKVIWKPDLPGSLFIKDLVFPTVTITTVMIFVFIYFGFQINNYFRLTLHAANALEMHKDELHNLAHYDSITHLPNRLLGMDRLAQALKASVRNHTLTAVLFIDLDHFKPVNDTYGHAVGDKLLTEIGKRFNESIRSGIDTVSRLGGDEFIIILANIKRREDVLLVAEKIVDILALEVMIDGIRINVTGSVGVAITDDPAMTPLAMIKIADTAMYQAKEQGKNQFCVAIK